MFLILNLNLWNIFYNQPGYNSNTNNLFVDKSYIPNLKTVLIAILMSGKTMVN